MDDMSTGGHEANRQCSSNKLHRYGRFQGLRFIKKMHHEKRVTAENLWEFEFPKFLGNGQKFCV